MSLLRAGLVPDLFHFLRAALCAPVLAALLSACATSSASTYEPPQRVSASAQYRHEGTHVVEMEADGLPAQPPPRRGYGTGPDDPSEPFSPNYGRDAAATPVQPGRHS